MNIDVIPFYCDGRVNMADEDTAPDVDVDVEELADKIMHGAGIAKVVRDAAEAALAPLANTERRIWVRENADNIKATGASEAAAWDAFCAGRVDELANELDAGLTEALINALDEEGDEGDDDDGDEDEPDEEDGDEDKAKNAPRKKPNAKKK